MPSTRAQVICIPSKKGSFFMLQQQQNLHVSSSIWLSARTRRPNEGGMTLNVLCFSFHQGMQMSFSVIPCKCSVVVTSSLLTTIQPRMFMAKVRSSQIKIRASEFPSFLYADASKYDPKKPYRGLLRGPLLVRVGGLPLS